MTDGNGTRTPVREGTNIAASRIGPQGKKISQRITLRSVEFRKAREQNWLRLEAILTRLDKKGVQSLTAEEIEQLPLLYRAALSALSVARTIALDRNLLLYLENLSLRAYLAVYGPQTGLIRKIWEFLRSGFPRSVRALSLHLAVAFLLLMVGTMAGFFLVQADVNYYTTLIPESLAGNRTPGATTEQLRKSLFQPWPGFVETFVVFANFLFRHNTMVGILCFGLGVAFGVPTALLLIYQGLILGAFVALFAQHGLAIDLIGWLSIHGVTEILAILLCGAAGLVVAERIIFPGRLSRMENLARYGREASCVVAGAVILFFIAGIIEGGFRQLISITSGRYGFALMTAALWLLYFLSGRRRTTHGDNA